MTRRPMILIAATTLAILSSCTRNKTLAEVGRHLAGDLLAPLTRKSEGQWILIHGIWSQTFAAAVYGHP